MATDRTLEKLAELAPEVGGRAYRFVDDARRVGAPVVIVEALRSSSRQAELVKQGASLTLASKHLSGRAFDCAWIVGGKLTWDVPQSWWDWLGQWGEYYGFTWGGRWRSLRDYGHFEL